MQYHKAGSSRTLFSCMLERLCKTALLAVFSMALLTQSFASDENAKPSADTVVLTVQGNVDGDKGKVIELNIDSLLALDATTFSSTAPWAEELTEYTGVRISTFLQSVGAKSNQFEAIAENEYRFTLKDIDFNKYPIIIAYKKNGEFLDTRTLGPLLIMFPFDDHPELLNEKNKAASVWQLKEIQIL